LKMKTRKKELRGRRVITHILTGGAGVKMG
jgi:hypothetical protein